MNASLGFAAFACITPPLAGQMPRDPVAVPGTSLGEFRVDAVAGANDLSAAAFAEVLDTDASRVYLSTSDGRGLSWSYALRVDEDPTDAWKSDVQVGVAGTRLFVAWRDWRNQALGDSVRDLYSNVFDTNAGSLLGEQWINTVYPEGSGTVETFKLGSANIGPVSLLHILFTVRDGAAGPAQAYLTTSANGGVSFSDPVLLSSKNAGSEHIVGTALAADGWNVYAAWAMPNETAGTDLWLQRSEQAGLGGFLPEPVQLTGAQTNGFIEAIDIAATSNGAVVVWEAECPSIAHEIRAAVSIDGGGSFADSVQVTSSQFATFEYLGVEADPASGNLVVAWEHSEFPVWPHSRVAVSQDGSAFGSSVALNSGHASGTTLTASDWSDNGGSMLAVTWNQLDSTGSLRGRVSYDGGATWEGDVVVFGKGVGSFHQVAWNSLYRNFILVWGVPTSGSYGPLVSGGFRAPTMAAKGLAPGPSAVSCTFDFFEPSTDAFGWALFALSPSDLLAIEGKILGLFPDVLFSSTLLAAVTGDLSSPIDGEGSGMTPQLGTNLPPGVTLYAIGLGLDLSAGFASVGSVTDVVEFQL